MFDQRGWKVGIVQNDDAAEIIRLRELLVASEARERRLRQALEAMVTTEEEDPCWYDHHGNCQAHGLQPKGECYMELARAALAEETNDG